MSYYEYGFAAVARVIESRWIACEVKDDISFGLTSGGELNIETTLCNEIREYRQVVVIDAVDFDDCYRKHHTPLQYGFTNELHLRSDYPPIFMAATQ